MVSPKGWEIWVIRSKEILFCPSKLLCSILSKKASTQYRRIALHKTKQKNQCSMCRNWFWTFQMIATITMTEQNAWSHMATGSVTYFQSIAKPFGQPRVVLTMDKACEPSPQALIILAGRYQSVQKIYLSDKSQKEFIINCLKQLLHLTKEKFNSNWINLLGLLLLSHVLSVSTILPFNAN